jgi:hypothetical protein
VGGLDLNLVPLKVKEAVGEDLINNKPKRKKILIERLIISSKSMDLGNGESLNKNARRL